MAMITKEIKLETTKPNLIQAIIAKQNDSNSRFLKVTLLDEGAVIPLFTSSTVTINAERKDGESKSFFGVVNADDTATVPLHSWMLELDGTVNCDVSIIDLEGRKLTTTTFVVMVEKAACGDDSISTDPQYEVLANLIDDVNETKQMFANAVKGEKSNWDYVAVDDFSLFDHEFSLQSYGFSFEDTDGRNYLPVFSKNFIDYREAYKEFFTIPTSRLFSATVKDLPAIKIPVPDELANHPLRFSAKIKNSEEECCLRVYVSHTDGTKQGGAKSTCSTTVFANSYIDFVAQKGDVLYLNYSKYGDSTASIMDMMLTLQDLKDCGYEDFYFKKLFSSTGSATNFTCRLSEFDSQSLVFIIPKINGTSAKIYCYYNRDINKALEALQNAIISLGGDL